jgi:3-methyladenine DNA glycosylase AlkD
MRAGNKWAAHEARLLGDELRAIGDPKRAGGEKKYLKSDLEFYGTGVPALRSVARRWKRTHPDATRDEILTLTNLLWATRVHELRSVGIALLDLYVDRLQAGDMAFVEDLLNKANTWAHVDWIAVRVAGALVTRYASARRILSRWAKDTNFWVRRSAMLALLNPLRAGEGDFDLFARFASDMIEEKEFFIRKAIGWILRETAKKRPKLTYHFLSDHIPVVAGLTLREGAKHLPPAQRDELLKRYRSR